MLTFKKTFLAGAAVLCIALAGCGGSDAAVTTPPPSHSSSGRVDLVFGDCSSFRRYAEAFVPEMVTIAESSATARRTLWAACFDGAPLRTLQWKPKVDFDDLPTELRSNPGLARRVNLARALGLKGKLARMVRDTPTRVRGSGQLEALEVAAQTEGVGRVFLFTDGAINQIDGIRLDEATPQQIEQTVARWAPRLRGLRGVELLFVGVGRGTHTTAGVRSAETLFRSLAQRVSVASFGWSLELPAGFNASESGGRR